MLIVKKNTFLGSVQIAIPRTKGCILRPKEMFKYRKVFGRLPGTELLCKLWRYSTKELLFL